MCPQTLCACLAAVVAAVVVVAPAVAAVVVVPAAAVVVAVARAVALDACAGNKRKGKKPGTPQNARSRSS